MGVLAAEAGATSAEQAAWLAQRSLVATIEQQRRVLPADETRVRNTLDLLRTSRADPALVDRFETMSQMLAQLALFRLQGRCNAYDSALRRLWTAATHF
jgi:hypothetical protein